MYYSEYNNVSVCKRENLNQQNEIQNRAYQLTIQAETHENAEWDIA